MADTTSRPIDNLWQAAMERVLLADGNYATLHDGTFELDDSGMLVDDQDIPVIARAPVGADGLIRFVDLRQGFAQHIAIWDATGHLLMRCYPFPVDGYPEWRQRREIPAGSTVEVQIHPDPNANPDEQLH